MVVPHQRVAVERVRRASPRGAGSSAHDRVPVGSRLDSTARSSSSSGSAPCSSTRSWKAGSEKPPSLRPSVRSQRARSSRSLPQAHHVRAGLPGPRRDAIDQVASESVVHAGALEAEPHPFLPGPATVVDAGVEREVQGRDQLAAQHAEMPDRIPVPAQLPWQLLGVLRPALDVGVEHHLAPKQRKRRALLRDRELEMMTGHTLVVDQRRQLPLRRSELARQVDLEDRRRARRPATRDGAWWCATPRRTPAPAPPPAAPAGGWRTPRPAAHSTASRSWWQPARIARRARHRLPPNARRRPPRGGRSARRACRADGRAHRRRRGWSRSDRSPGRSRAGGSPPRTRSVEVWHRSS